MTSHRLVPATREKHRAGLLTRLPICALSLLPLIVLEQPMFTAKSAFCGWDGPYCLLCCCHPPQRCLCGWDAHHRPLHVLDHLPHQHPPGGEVGGQAGGLWAGGLVGFLISTHPEVARRRSEVEHD